jgi:hypothetical protein
MPTTTDLDRRLAGSAGSAPASGHRSRAESHGAWCLRSRRTPA